MADLNKKTSLGISKREQFKLIIAILGFFLVVSIFFTVGSVRKEIVDENKKAEIVVHVKERTVIDYRNEFKYEPNYDNFFEVEDQLDEKPVALSDGELKILEFVGSLMHRVHPKKVQEKAKNIPYSLILENSNQQKGQVLDVVGKIVKIRTFKPIEQIKSAKFVHSFVLETIDGGLFDVRVAVDEPTYKLGDIVYGAGIFLKLSYVKELGKPAALVLCNQAILLFASPVMWQNQERYQKEVNSQMASFKDLLKLPEPSRYDSFKTDYIESSKKAFSLWSLIEDDDPEKSRKIPPEVEFELIKNLTEVPDEFLLENSKIVPDYKELIGDSKKYRGQEFIIKGKVESLLRADADIDETNVNKVYYAKVIDHRGDVFYFNYIKPTFIDEGDRIDLKDTLIPQKGEFVVCSGIFLQKTNDIESKQWVPVIYGKKMAVIGQYDKIWDSVTQGDERTALNDYGENAQREAGMIEPMPFSYLIGKVSYASSSNIVKSYYNQKEENRLTFEKMMKEPEKCYDQPYVIFGKMMMIKQIEDPRNYLFHGVKRVYEYYFVDRDNNLYSFIGLNKMEGVIKGKRMTFAGYFMKRFAYKNKEGNIQWSPFMVGKIHELEMPEVKKLTKVDWAILLFLMFSVVVAFIRINKQSAKNKERINELRNRQIRRNKIDREKLKDLESTGVELDQALILPFHTMFQDYHKLALEVCLNEKEWVEKGGRNTQWRPDYLNLAVSALEDHFKNYDTSLPKDVENNFFNKKKEMLGLRPYQNSKYVIPMEEKKRKDSFIMLPVKSFKGKIHTESMKGYFDEFGMPPWLTWVYFGPIPKFVFKEENMNYKPSQEVLIACVPEFMDKELSSKFKVLKIYAEKGEVDESKS